MSDAASGPRVIFLKLGGSLITDKDHPKTSNRAAIARALGELRKCMSRTSATFVLTHGSGSFGHATAIAEQFGQKAPPSVARMLSAARIHESVSELHRQVIQEGLRIDLPLWSLMPSQFLQSGEEGPRASGIRSLILSLCARGAIPTLCGDVMVHEQYGAAICSTEPLIEVLWRDVFQPAGFRGHAVWAGTTDGLLDEAGHTVPLIASAEAQRLAGPSGSPDVTGGMALRVATTLALARNGCESWLVNGTRPGAIASALLLPDALIPHATRVRSPDHSS